MIKLGKIFLTIMMLLSYMSSAYAVVDVPNAARSVRIKDITHIDGVRDNQLVGYGVVVGLSGTGDNSRSTQITNQLMLQNLGTIITNSNDIKNVFLIFSL